MTAPALPLSRGSRAGRAPRPLATGRNALLVVGYGIAIALICIGSYGAAGTGHVDDGIAWLVVSILGLVVAGITNGLWFMDARRRLSRERIQVFGPGRPRPRYTKTATALVDAPPAAEHPVSRPNSMLFHRPSCELVLGRTTTAALRPVHEADGRRPCEVCEP